MTEQTETTQDPVIQKLEQIAGTSRVPEIRILARDFRGYVQRGSLAADSEGLTAFIKSPTKYYENYGLKVKGIDC